MVMACTYAPATTPLCAIGVAMAIPFAQLCPGPPGIFDGYRKVTVGTFHEISPISSEGPPVGSAPRPPPPSPLSMPQPAARRNAGNSRSEAL